MRHAGASALARLTPLLTALRTIPELRERKPGIFYRGSRAFLHFHEDPAGLFADMRLGGEAFERYPATSAAEQERLLAHIRQQLLEVR